MDIETDLEIKKRLSHTWNVFFGTFGKLQEIQRKTIPLILDGENLVISSPAATGKTEAIVAPIIEKFIVHSSWLTSSLRIRDKITNNHEPITNNQLSILYVSPTRALVNDLYERLKPPLEQLGIGLGRRTGDRKEFNLKKPEPFLITTPESLDSLISRHPQIFGNLKVIVLDEIHLLYNSYRGDQLKILLERLKFIGKITNNHEPITNNQIKFYALSATISDPQEIGNLYLPPDFKVVTVPGNLEIEYYLFGKDNVFSSLIREFKRRNIKKVLAFVNSRQEAEALVKQFRKPPFNDRVWVHHGSLGKGEREEIEDIMHNSPVGICIATSTLEFGIDIGNIDAVVLFGPPPDVNSLLQRIGRGCRRRENYMLAYGIYSSQFERILFYTSFEEVKCGRLTKKQRIFDPSVGCQQIFSYLYQKRAGGTSLGSIKRLLGSAMKESDIERIVESLLEKEVIECSKGKLFFLTPKLGRVIGMGKVHSNIPDGFEYMVIDAKTGKKIGIIQKPLPRFGLGGRRWSIASIDKNIIYVTPLKGIGGRERVFSGNKAMHWDFQIGKKLKEQIFESVDEKTFPYFKAEGKVFIFHFVGPMYELLWQQTVNNKGIKVEDVGDFLFVTEKILDPSQLLFTEDELIETAEKIAFHLKYFLNFGTFFNFLSQDMKREAIIASLRLEEFIDYIKNICFQEISKETGLKIMQLLIPLQLSSLLS